MPEVITSEQLRARVEEVLGDMVEEKGEDWAKWPNFRLTNGVFVEFSEYGGGLWSSYRNYDGVNINIREIGTYRSQNKKYMRLKYDTKREDDKQVNYVKFDSDKLLSKVAEVAANSQHRKVQQEATKQRTAEAQAKTIELFPNHVIDNEFHLEPIGAISVTGSVFRYEGLNLIIKGSTHKDPSYVRIDMEMPVPLSELDSFLTKMQEFVDDGNAEKENKTDGKTNVST